MPSEAVTPIALPSLSLPFLNLTMIDLEKFPILLGYYDYLKIMQIYVRLKVFKIEIQKE